MKYNAAMKCINCQQEIPEKSRFCLNCGAAQPLASDPSDSVQVAASEVSPADSSSETRVLPQEYENGEFNWMAREMMLDPNLDYEAARRFDGWAGRGIGCLAYLFFGIIGLIALIPGVPLLALGGIPAAIILGLLIFFGIGGLPDKIHSIGWLNKLPGIASPNPHQMAFAVGGWLTFASLISIGIMVLSTRR